MKKCLVSQKAFCTGQQDDFSPNPQQPSSTSLPSSANLVASWCWNSLWPFASMPMRKKKLYNWKLSERSEIKCLILQARSPETKCCSH